MKKKLEELPSGSVTFIDSNIFIYEFSSHSKYGKSCRNFLERVEQTEFLGVTSVTVLDEVLYKSMLIELSNIKEISISEASTEMRDNPEAIKDLDTSISNVKELLDMPILILEVTQNNFEEGMKYIKKHNLRPHDATILETLNFHSIENIATNDPDFESVEWLNIFQPTKTEG